MFFTKIIYMYTLVDLPFALSFPIVGIVAETLFFKFLNFCNNPFSAQNLKQTFWGTVDGIFKLVKMEKAYKCWNGIVSSNITQKRIPIKWLTAAFGDQFYKKNYFSDQERNDISAKFFLYTASYKRTDATQKANFKDAKKRKVI